MEIILYRESLVDGKWSNGIMFIKFWKCMIIISIDIYEVGFSGN